MAIALRRLSEIELDINKITDTLTNIQTATGLVDEYFSTEFSFSDMFNQISGAGQLSRISGMVSTIEDIAEKLNRLQEIKLDSVAIDTAITNVYDVVVEDVVYFKTLVGHGRYRYLGVRWVDVYVATVTYVVVIDDTVFLKYVTYLGFFFGSRLDLYGIELVFSLSEFQNVSLDGLDRQAIFVDFFDVVSGRLRSVGLQGIFDDFESNGCTGRVVVVERVSLHVENGGFGYFVEPPSLQLLFGIGILFLRFCLSG
jgi:hypothetical protein